MIPVRRWLVVLVPTVAIVGFVLVVRELLFRAHLDDSPSSSDQDHSH